MAREVVYIGYGSNQDDRADFCDRAVWLLSLLPHSQVTGVSPRYETEPVADERTNPGHGWFLNGVVRLETELTPQGLLAVCREIEQALGRDHDRRHGPRTLDLDILFYGSRIVDEAGLTIPHPRLHLRRFVLAPMADLAPDWRHPILGETMQALLNRLGDAGTVRRLEPPSADSASRPTCTADRRSA
jgi:2-amino-4-hydroxy-6-hydroxymethyldihydropteridine diphosphokinase